MTAEFVTGIALLCAALPAFLAIWNRWFFQPPPRLTEGTGHSEPQPSISVLIPARNEESTIEACLKSVLASREVELEVVVLDDHSDDRTAENVRAIASIDRRVRLESAPPLPEGWCGKQHACHVLSHHARYPLLAFLDADVRLAPDALARMAAFLKQSRAGLVSGFPRQETETLLEKLVIPLISWLLMCYLPMIGMRRSHRAAFAVGCGQWFLTTRLAYLASGGHEAIRASRHDGLMLPRAYRRAGFHTDIADTTDLAVCRMYRSASEVWLGLAKNAREGMAATSQIGFWTIMLFCGQILPYLVLAMAAVGSLTWVLALVACVLASGTRLMLAGRFRLSWLGAILHPVGILTLLGIQWFAIYRAIRGRPVGWKGRTQPAVEIAHPSHFPGLTVGKQ